MSRQTDRQVERLRERARKLRESDAFAPADNGIGNGVDIGEVSRDLKASRRRYRRLCAVFAVAVLAVVVLSLPIPFVVDSTQSGVYYSFGDVLDTYVLAFRTYIVPIFDPTQANLVPQMHGDFDAAHPVVGPSMYYQVTMRFALTVLTVACGFMLAVSGLLFQSSFRNPLAVPTMLGVSDGVSVGYLIFMALGYSQMPNNPVLFFICAYGGGIVVLLFVLFSSRFIAGSKTYNVFDMLLIGTVVSQMVGGCVTFYTNYGLDLETWNDYYELLQSVDITGEPLSYAIAFAVCAVATVPVVIYRFKLNLTAFSDEEGKMLGVRPAALRGLAMVCGSLMQLAAIVSLGQVAMVSLAVPFLARLLFPSDFRRQLLGNFLIGSFVLLLCQLLAHFAVFGAVVMPIGTIVSLVIVPFFVWMTAMSKRNGWE